MAMTRQEMLGRAIAVLLGGWSAEREVSLRSGAACARALRARGYRVVEIDASRDLPAQLVAARAEVVFMSALHGKFGEDGCVQGLLEVLGLPYTGSDVLASALAMDKVAAKRAFASQGVPITEHVLVSEADGAALPPFGLPAVVKPRAEGSSVGVTLVHTAEAYRPALAEALRYDPVAIVERYVKAREIQIAVLDEQVLGAIEIVVTEREFYDYTAKYGVDSNRYLVPAPLPPDLTAEVHRIGLAAHRALGCAGATRVDLLVGPQARPGADIYVLEVNTLPGMTDASLLPKVARHAGLSFEDLCERILLGAHCRSPRAATGVS